MSQIGSGLEYRVYDHGPERVLKVRRSIPGRLLSSFKYSLRSGTLGGWAKIALKLLPLTNEVPDVAARLKRSPAEMKKLLGHMELVQGNDYTQDRVTPLRAYFAEHSFEENLAVVARYITLTKSLWSLGVGDPYYSFLWNAGVYADGSVTQIDVADLSTDLSIVGESVHRQTWLLTAVSCIQDERFRTECANLLNSDLTYEAFLEAWPDEKPARKYSTNRYPGAAKGNSFAAGLPWASALRWYEKLRGAEPSMIAGQGPSA